MARSRGAASARARSRNGVSSMVVGEWESVKGGLYILPLCILIQRGGIR